MNTKEAERYLEYAITNDNPEYATLFALVSIAQSQIAISKKLDSIIENLRMGPEYTPPTYKVVSVKDGKTKTYP